MPSIAWNRRWDQRSMWTQGGEEWSVTWGGSYSQWMGTLLPRLSRFLPAGAILEIAPGYGRWTRFLVDACDRYLGVDLSKACVDACRDRFADVPHAEFVQNNGRSLSRVKDGSIDLVFSFDSLVHVDFGVLRGYLEQIVLKLTDHGVALVHHSNALAADASEAAQHARAPDVSAQLVRDALQRAGGRVLVQEEINWGVTTLIDAITLFSREAAYVNCEPTLIKNPRFMLEAELIRLNQSPYASICQPDRSQSRHELAPGPDVASGLASSRHEKHLARDRKSLLRRLLRR